MTDKLFNELWLDALGQPDREIYIAKYGLAEWASRIGKDYSEIIKVLESIHEVAHMSVKDMILYTGLSQAKFATRFCIPISTVEKWCMEKQKCRDYERLMIAKILGILEV